MLVEQKACGMRQYLAGSTVRLSLERKNEEAREAMLVIKTTEDNVLLVEEALKSLHSYELPEFVVLNVDGVSDAYLQWIQSSVR